MKSLHYYTACEVYSEVCVWDWEGLLLKYVKFCSLVPTQNILEYQKDSFSCSNFTEFILMIYWS